MRFHLTADLHSHTVHGEVRGVSPHLLPCGLSGQLVCQLMESLLSLPPDSRGLQTLSGTGIQVGQWFRSLCLTSSANLPTEPSLRPSSVFLTAPGSTQPHLHGRGLGRLAGGPRGPPLLLLNQVPLKPDPRVRDTLFVSSLSAPGRDDPNFLPPPPRMQQVQLTR